MTFLNKENYSPTLTFFSLTSSTLGSAEILKRIIVNGWLYIPFPFSLIYIIFQKTLDIRLQFFSNGLSRNILTKILIKDLIVDFKSKGFYRSALCRLFLVIEWKSRKHFSEYLFTEESSKKTQFSLSRFAFFESRFNGYWEGLGIETERKHDHIIIWRSCPAKELLQAFWHFDEIIKEGDTLVHKSINTDVGGFEVTRELGGSVVRGLFARRGKILLPVSNYSELEISRELPFPGLFFDKSNKTRFFCSSKTIEKSTALYAGFNPNYYHFSWEIFPRISLFYEKFGTGIPTALSQELPASLKRMVDLVSGIEPLSIRMNEEFHFEELFITYDARYKGPVEYKSHKAGNIFKGRESDLERLRSLSGMLQDDSLKNLPRNIFVGRVGINSRNPENISEIRSLVSNLDYIEINPLEITFDEQVRFFQGAEVICIIAGAAMTNLAYCKNLHKVVIVIPDGGLAYKVFWQNYCEFLRVEYHVVHYPIKKDSYGPVNLGDLMDKLIKY